MQVCTLYRCDQNQRVYTCDRVCICARVCAVCLFKFALGDESGRVELVYAEHLSLGVG